MNKSLFNLTNNKELWKDYFPNKLSYNKLIN